MSWTGTPPAPQQRSDHGIAGTGMPPPDPVPLRHPPADGEVGLTGRDRGGHDVTEFSAPTAEARGDQGERRSPGAGADGLVLT
jgi:hypothetical protein